MRRSLLPLTLLFLSYCAPLRAQQIPPASISMSTPTLEVVWPRGGDKFPFLKRSFTFGAVTPGAALTINGQAARVGEDGAFFEMVDFSSGAFALDYEAAWQGLSVSTRHLVEVGPPFGLPETGPDQLLALEPAADKELRVSDLILVRCKGPPGLKGTFSISGIAGTQPLVESSGPVAGLYEGHYVIGPGDSGANHEVSCSLKRGFFSGLKAKAPGKITVAAASRLRAAVTAAPITVLKSAAGGYSLFLPPDIQLQSTGRDGGLLKVSLSAHEEGWVDSSRVKVLPEGTPPPRGVIGQTAATYVSTDSVRLVIDSDPAVPFEVRHTIEPLAFEIRFYGASHHFDRIRYADDDPIIRGVRWRQEDARAVLVSVDTRLSWGWGYDAGYDGHGHFILEIRRPPDLTRPGSPLSGRHIVLDPGHGPDKGAAGPRGTLERDLNLSIAFKLEKLLEAEGADVFMIRTSSSGPPLTDRPGIAWKQGGDLYLSIHNNAFPETEDPFAKPRGYMVFYYQSLSRPLAEAMHRAYQKQELSLADEQLQWGNLHVCRVTQMPSVLTESAYVILPDQEKRLLDPAYQDKLAQTMLAGIRSFYQAYRSLQLQNRAERLAAKL